MQRAIGRRVKLEEIGGRSIEADLPIKLAADLELNGRGGGTQIRLQVERKLADDLGPFSQISRRTAPSPRSDLGRTATPGG